MADIKAGQEYESCVADYTQYSQSGSEHTRIRILAEPVTTPGVYGYGKVRVATLELCGREVRPRRIALSQLHETGTTKDGQPRRTGYRLVKEA